MQQAAFASYKITLASEHVLRVIIIIGREHVFYVKLAYKILGIFS